MSNKKPLYSDRFRDAADIPGISFQHGHGNARLCQQVRRRQPRRTCPDDDHIILFVCSLMAFLNHFAPAFFAPALFAVTT